MGRFTSKGDPTCPKCKGGGTVETSTLAEPRFQGDRRFMEVKCSCVDAYQARRKTEALPPLKTFKDAKEFRELTGTGLHEGSKIIRGSQLLQEVRNAETVSQIRFILEKLIAEEYPPVPFGYAYRPEDTKKESKS